MNQENRDKATATAQPLPVITGAEALLRSLTAEGVDTVFGYPGGAIINVYDALYSYPQIRHILCRHEQGAIHAAQGYARATGKPGVVIVTSGPGAANTVTGLSDAMADSTPVVVISGQVGSRYLGSDAFQETDVVAVTQPITKWAVQVRKAEDVPSAVAKAFYIASSGRPGPVVIDIAKDAQASQLAYEHRPVKFIRSYDPNPQPSEESIASAARLINGAERPLLLIGRGVSISQAEREALQLAEKAGIPTGATLLGLSCLPSGHPLYLGMTGLHGTLAANYATNHADVIIGVGMRFDDRVTGNTDYYAPQAKIIHIDIDPSEFDKTVAATVRVNGDARGVLSRLLPLVSENHHTEWLEKLRRCDAVEQKEVMEAELCRPDNEPLTMGRVIKTVGEKAPEGTIGVTDVGQNQMMSARYFRQTLPKGFITSGGAGTMGFGLPASIGAAIGAPERTVCYFGGDGGMQMTIQELGTIMQYKVPVKMILLDNQALGNVKQWQTLFFGSRYSQTPLLNPDFKGIAQAYGIAYANVVSAEQLEEAVEWMFASEGPFLLHVAIDTTDMVFPMMPLSQSANCIMLNPDKKFDQDAI